MPAGRRQSFRIFPGEGAEFTDGGVFFQDDFALAIREDLEGIALLDPEGAANFLWDDDPAEVVDSPNDSCSLAMPGLSLSLLASVTERCLPPVQPMPMTS